MHKARRRKESVRFLSMKKPMYDNIRMFDPDGKLLCTISKKKAAWYVQKKLGKWMEDDQDSSQPPTRLHLTFVPKQGQVIDPNDYTKAPKQNICVSCGDDQNHMRHYVVPYCYRSLLPAKYKSHMPHDIVLLCSDCHLTCEQATMQRKQWLERKLRKDPSTAFAVVPHPELHRVKSAATALLQHRAELPPPRIAQLEARVRAHVDGLSCDDSKTTSSTTILTNQVLQQASTLETNLPNPTFISGARLVVDDLQQDDNRMASFIRDWRRHFVEVLQPHHLPTGWSIDAEVHCDDRPP